MPELPEVETIKRQLVDKVVGLTIENVLVNKPKLFVGNPQKIIGLRVLRVMRRAKMIIIDLENDQHLLIHLKMSGQLIYADKFGQYGGGHPIPPSNIPVPNKFTHIIIEFSNGSKLYYNDIRQFGWIKILTKKKLEDELKKLGPEPLTEEFTPEKFRENLFIHNKSKIKPTLMDQSVVAGVGNIYACEACFMARIDPRRQIKSLTTQEIKSLFCAIKKVLALAIKYRGTSADAYVTLEGRKGDYYNRRLVYNREGEQCPNNCGGKITKIMLAGRGTYFCPMCQK